MLASTKDTQGADVHNPQHVYGPGEQKTKRAASEKTDVFSKPTTVSRARAGALVYTARWREDVANQVHCIECLRGAHC